MKETRGCDKPFHVENIVRVLQVEQETIGCRSSKKGNNWTCKVMEREAWSA